MKYSFIFVLFLFLFTLSCSGQTEKKYKQITYSDLPDKIQNLADSIVGNSDGTGYFCMDVSGKCKECTSYNDDVGLVGILINREPRIVIKMCDKTYKVPITYQGNIFFIDKDKIYYPYIAYIGGDIDEPLKKLKEYQDIKGMEYRVINISDL